MWITITNDMCPQANDTTRRRLQPEEASPAAIVRCVKLVMLYAAKANAHLVRVKLIRDGPACDVFSLTRRHRDSPCGLFAYLILSTGTIKLNIMKTKMTGAEAIIENTNA